MMRALASFAALSLAGTVILSLLPDGGIKRTASMAVGLLTLMCWAEGIATLLGIPLSAKAPRTLLTPTSYQVEDAIQEASAAMRIQWEAEP